MKTRLVFFIFMVCSFLPNIYAEKTQDEVFKQRVAERVALMNDYISFMADKRNSIEERNYYKKKALNLFIGKGGPFIDNDAIGGQRNGVTMETTNVKDHTKSKKLLKDYFDNLIKLKYSDVKVTSTQAANMKVSDLKKVDDNLYVCSCEYLQYFYGFRDGELVYGDKVVKRIACYVQIDEVEGGYEAIVQLGDVTADQNETERIY